MPKRALKLPLSASIRMVVLLAFDAGRVKLYQVLVWVADPRSGAATLVTQLLPSGQLVQS
jgi:hypothetical protein